MKLITAIIKPFKLEDVKVALEAAGEAVGAAHVAGPEVGLQAALIGQPE